MLRMEWYGATTDQEVRLSGGQPSIVEPASVFVFDTTERQ